MNVSSNSLANLRPAESEYTPELARRICDELVSPKSLRRICQEEWAPNKMTVMRWLRKHEEFRAAYTQAREDQAEGFADDIIDISDDGSNDYMATENPDHPGYRLCGENVQRSKLRVDSRKWVAANLLPKKYGDKTQITGAGGKDLIPETPITEIARRLAFLLTAGAKDSNE